MGLIDRWKVVRATYREWYEEGRASVPQWARIVAVGRPDPGTRPPASS